ncbi:MAG: GNAT family N-acetyltransferase [Janthinobacterium lividum]
MSTASSWLDPSPGSLRFSLLPARLDDLAAVLRLEEEGFPAEERWSERSWSGELLGQGRTVLIARGAQPAGVLALSTVGELADLHRVVVAPAYRRQGLALRMVRAGLLAVRHLGARAVMLEVEWTNVGAIALYQRLGFEQLRVRRDYYGPGQDALILKLYDLQTWPGRFAEAVADTEADLLREGAAIPREPDLEHETGLSPEGGRPPTPPAGFQSPALPKPDAGETP